MADLNKLLEEIKSLTVLELNDFVKALEEEFGVSAAAGVVVAGPAAAGDAPKEEEKTEFDVVLKEIGPNKVQVIKVVKEATGLGLVEAKAVVDGAPKTVKEALPKDAAEALAAKLKEVGAVAELK
ncbi:MAG: 50S ribosomal protein L7/L12 [Clostridia bacterium]|nr:50S ribosomal protein L7/L12 [Clostridia bacterium]